VPEFYAWFAAFLAGRARDITALGTWTPWPAAGARAQAAPPVLALAALPPRVASRQRARSRSSRAKRSRRRASCWRARTATGKGRQAARSQGSEARTAGGWIPEPAGRPLACQRGEGRRAARRAGKGEVERSRRAAGLPLQLPFEAYARRTRRFGARGFPSGGNNARVLFPSPYPKAALKGLVNAFALPTQDS
jgi:hypothetical protein